MTAKRILLVAEMLVLFVALPVLFLFDFLPGLWKVLPLVLFMAYCFYILVKRGQIKKQDFLLKHIKTSAWLKMFIFPTGLFAVLYWQFPEILWADFNDRHVLIAIITYPLFSCLPQEIIYRQFFYFQYEKLLNNRYVLIALNAIIFSFAHIYFENYIALILTLLGGIAFSWTYLKTRSLLFVSIEHSVYGLALLCSGLNQYFYKAF
ncbi:MAG: CPBP family intramembrane glutamic endopeptidase [Bacteroidota bacterium]